jgi:hypothetical protein
MKRLLAALAFVVVLAGCASSGMVKVSPGETVVGDRVALTIEGAWNQLSIPGSGSTATWTQDGIPLDLLRFYVALKDGQALGGSGAKDQRPLTFKSTMQPHEIVSLFQGLYARDGSTFTLGKLEPAEFMGAKGFRFQYTVVRKSDDVTLSGVAWVVVQGHELYAMTFTAPRVGFYARHEVDVERIAKSARLKG